MLDVLARKRAPELGRQGGAGDIFVPDKPGPANGAGGAPVALVVLIDVSPAARLWGHAAFLLGRFSLARAGGMRFFKMLGSGRDGGFGLAPSATRQGMFCVFDDDRQVDAFLAHHPVVAAYRARAREFFSVRLRTTSVRGSWSGAAPLVAATPSPGAEARPVAALTRASILPRRAAAFWRHAPPAEVSLGQSPGCLLAAGLGEAPLLRQATFSIWKSTAAMNAYARRGAHQAAIQASAAGGYFSESMFARFEPYDARGVWHGRGVELAGADVAGADVAGADVAGADVAAGHP